MRQHPIPAEKKLWAGFLRKINNRVLHQRPIDNHILNINCAQLKWVIEIDGDTHLTISGRDYDEARTKMLEGYGLCGMRFINREVLNIFDAVCQTVQEIPLPPL